MAEVIIVTKQCYLVCERINSITITETDEGDRVFSLSSIRKNSKKKTKKPIDKKFRIVIDFVPLSANSPSNQYSSNGNTAAVAIEMRGEKAVLGLFKQIVDQIREQQPDKLWLDKLVEKFFAENPD